MAVVWKREGSIFVVEATGSYSTESLMGVLDEILEADDFPAPAGILLDARYSDSLLRRSSGEIRAIARGFAERSVPFGYRCALVVDGLLRYGLARMASAWAGAHSVHAEVFRKPAPALAWLQRETQRSSA